MTAFGTNGKGEREMNKIQDCHKFNMLTTQEQIEALRMAILQRLRIEEPTLRDQFAMTALTGYVSVEDNRTYKPNLKESLESWQDRMIQEDAQYCYKLADVMLKAREEKSQ